MRPTRHGHLTGTGAPRRLSIKLRDVTFLLGSTWLALHVFVAEHGSLLMAAAACGIAPARTLARRPA